MTRKILDIHSTCGLIGSLFSKTQTGIYLSLIHILNGCVQEVFECFTTSNSGKEISETLYKCKECIVDVEVLRKALKKWYAFKKQGDRSKQVIAYYRENNFGMPEDVIRTVKQMHNSL